MHRLPPSILFLVLLFLACSAFGQDASSRVTCSFDADKELTVEYQRVSFNLKKPIFGHEVSYGKVWAPGAKPLTLFTNSAVEIGGKTLPVGAYTMFVLPTQKQWTLVISKSADLSGKYDQQQDLVRVSMESGELPSPVPDFSAAFAHVAPDQCSFRVELAKTGNWATFQKK